MTARAENLTYLACPYSHESELVKAYRVAQVNRAAARLLRGTGTVFSPISHSHGIAESDPTLGSTWEFWEEKDLPFLDYATRVVVLTLDGWRESRGVQAEIKYAMDHGLPVYYMTRGGTISLEPGLPEVDHDF